MLISNQNTNTITMPGKHSLVIANNVAIYFIAGCIISVNIFMLPLLTVRCSFSVFLLAYFICILMWTLVSFAMYNNPVVIIALLLFHYGFHYILIGIFAQPAATPTHIKMLLASKGILMYAIIIGMLLAAITKRNKTVRRRKIVLLKADKIAIAYLVVISLYFVYSQERLLLKAMSFQNFTSIPIFYFIGRLLKLKGNKHIAILVFFLTFTSILVVPFGFIERFVVRDMFWNDIAHVSETWQEKGSVAPDDDVPNCWSTGLNYVEFDRMVSIFANPVATGYFMAFMFLLYPIYSCLYVNLSRIRPISFAIVAFLTFSKSAWLIMLIGYITLKSLVFRNLGRKFVVFIFIPLLVLVLVYIGSNLLQTSVSCRINALYNGCQCLIDRPLGYGLGTSGISINALGYKESQLEDYEVSENAISVIVSQMGWPGVVLCMWFLLNILQTFLKYYEGLSQSNHHFAKSLVCSMIAITATFITTIFFNEASITPFYNFSYMLCVGMCISVFSSPELTCYTTITLGEPV